MRKAIGNGKLYKNTVKNHWCLSEYIRTNIPEEQRILKEDLVISKFSATDEGSNHTKCLKHFGKFVSSNRSRINKHFFSPELSVFMCFCNDNIDTRHMFLPQL